MRRRSLAASSSQSARTTSASPKPRRRGAAASRAVPGGMEHEQDAHLLAVLARAEHLFRTDDNFTTGKSLAEILSPRPWEIALAEAAALPARTIAGLRAKSRAIHMLVTLPSGNLPQWANITEHLQVSLHRDIERPTRRAKAAAVSPDAELIDLCAEYIRASDAFNASDEVGDDEPLMQAWVDADARLKRSKATTLEGLAAKARVAAYLAENDPDWPEPEESSATAMAAAIVRDLLRIMDGAA